MTSDLQKMFDSFEDQLTIHVDYKNEELDRILLFIRGVDYQRQAFFKFSPSLEYLWKYDNCRNPKHVIVF